MFAVCAGALWLGGAGSLQAAQRIEALSAGRGTPRAATCAPSAGRRAIRASAAGARRPSAQASRGRWTAAAAANPLGAFTGLAAWVLAAASLLTLAGAGAGWLRRTGALVLALLPVAFVVNAVVWWHLAASGRAALTRRVARSAFRGLQRGRQPMTDRDLQQKRYIAAGIDIAVVIAIGIVFVMVGMVLGFAFSQRQLDLHGRRRTFRGSSASSGRW